MSDHNLCLHKVIHVTTAQAKVEVKHTLNNQVKHEKQKTVSS